MSEKTLEDSVRDFDAKKRGCVAFLERVRELKAAYDRDFCQGAEQGAPDEQTLDVRSIRLLAEKLGEARLKILVAGEFKTGKSTLLNALLGQEVLPADVSPCTAVITEIDYGEHKTARLFFKPGPDLAALPKNLRPEARAHIEKHAPDIPPLRLDIGEGSEGENPLDEYLAIGDDDDEPLDQSSAVRASPYARCLVTWPLELCRLGATIVDSPGLNEAGARDATTLDYLPEADMVLYVLNASQLCSKEDKKFIEGARQAGNMPFIFAVNRFDQLNSDRDRDKIRDRARKNPVLLGPYGPDGIFFTSARQALAGRMENDREKYRASGFAGMEEKIAEIFERDRGRIKLSAFASILPDIGAMAARNIPALLGMLDSDGEALAAGFEAKQAEFRKLEDDISRIRATVAAVLERYELEFRSRLGEFFSSFVYGEVPRIVAETALPEIRLRKRREDTEAAVRVLNGAVTDRMREALTGWMNESGRELREKYLDEIRRESRRELEIFRQRLSVLRTDLSLSKLEESGAAIDIRLDSFLTDNLAGAGMIAGAGAGVAYGLEWFLAARFAPVLLGPVGWAIVIASTAAAVFAFLDMGSQDAAARIREKYLPEAKSRIREELEIFETEIPAAARRKLEEEIAPLCAHLSRQVNEARNTVREAIESLHAGSVEVERKKRALEDFRQKFAALAEEGREMQAKL